MNSSPLPQEITAAVSTLPSPASVFRDGDVAAALTSILRESGRRPRLPSGPPFEFLPGAGAAETGRAIAAVYERFATGPAPGLARILAAAFDRLEVPSGSPARLVALMGAVLASVPSGNPFHNLNHTREVVCNLIWLIQANAHLAAADTAGGHVLGADLVGTLLLAATIHDLAHDGTDNMNGDGYEPYRLEDGAFRLIEPALIRAGFEAASRRRIHVLLRCTDPRLREAARVHIDRALYGAPAVPEGPLPELETDLADPETALMAALLCDADIMSSAGLTPAYHNHLSRLVAAERGRPYSLQDSREFFSHVVGGSFASAAGKLLDSNLQAIRAAVD